MTEAPIWPGVAEYLYHAASLALVTSDGTWIVPSALSPRYRSFEVTPMAGIATDTGTERCSDGPWPAGPIAPPAAAEGCGACCWDRNVPPTAAVPPMMSRTPVTPASRARKPTCLGGRENPVSGHEATTRNPAIRGHLAPLNAPSFGVFYSSSVIFRAAGTPLRVFAAARAYRYGASVFNPGKFFGRPGQRPKAGRTFSLPAPVSAAGDRE